MDLNEHCIGVTGITYDTILKKLGGMWRVKSWLIDQERKDSYLRECMPVRCSVPFVVVYPDASAENAFRAEVMHSEWNYKNSGCPYILRPESRCKYGQGGGAIVQEGLSLMLGHGTSLEKFYDDDQKHSRVIAIGIGVSKTKKPKDKAKRSAKPKPKPEAQGQGQGQGRVVIEQGGRPRRREHGCRLDA